MTPISFPINNEQEFRAAMALMQRESQKQIGIFKIPKGQTAAPGSEPYLVASTPSPTPSGDRLELWKSIIKWTMAIEGGLGLIEGDRGGITYRGIASNFLPEGEFKRRIITGTATDEECINFYLKKYVNGNGLDFIENPRAMFYAFNESIWGRTHLQINVWDYFVKKEGFTYGLAYTYPNKYQRLALLRNRTDLEIVQFLNYCKSLIDVQANELKDFWNDAKINGGVKRHSIANRYRQVIQGALDELFLKPTETLADGSVNWRALEKAVEIYRKYA